MTAPAILRVALPVPLRQHFDYLIASDQPCQIGCRVLVPFGNRKLVGIIWQLAPEDGFDASKLKTVLQLLDTAPLRRTLCPYAYGALRERDDLLGRHDQPYRPS